MRWFNLLKNIKPVIQESIKKPGTWLDVKQHLLANFLQSRSEKLSAGQKKAGIILFMVLGTALCGHIIYTGLSGQSRTVLNLPKGGVHNSTVLRMGESMESINTELAIRNLVRFKHYMDSLKTTATGQVKYDSLTAGRPGMMDSINYIINNR